MIKALGVIITKKGPEKFRAFFVLHAVGII